MKTWIGHIDVKEKPNLAPPNGISILYFLELFSFLFFLFILLTHI